MSNPTAIVGGLMALMHRGTVSIHLSDPELPAENLKVEIPCVRVTAADFNGHDWDGSPFDPAPAPDWFRAELGNAVKLSDGNHCTDYAVWSVNGVEAWPGDYIVRADDGTLSVVKYSTPATPRVPE